MNKLGIDFGTSYSTICALGEDGKPSVIRVNYKEKIPTVVYWGEDGKIEIGESAFNRWKDSFDLDDENEKFVEQSRVIRSVKRNFTSDYKITLPDNTSVACEEVVAKIIAYLVDEGKKYFFGNVDEVTVTCPATFTPQQEELLKKALNLAGVCNYTLMSDGTFLKEPLAAAIAHSAQSKASGVGILVYDLGGGTFDLSYIHHDDDGNWRIPLPPVGNAHCGGDDIDRAVYEHVKKLLECDVIKEGEVIKKGVVIEKTPGSINMEVLNACNELKEALSFNDKSNVTLLLDVKRKIELTRPAFEELIRDLIGSTVNMTEEYLKEIQSRGYNVDTLVLIGGSSTIPLASRMLAEISPVPPVLISDADIAVAQGAAIYKPNGVTIVETPTTPAETVMIDVPKPIKRNPLDAKCLCKYCKKPIYNENAFVCFECGALQDSSLISPDSRVAFQERVKGLVKRSRNCKISESTKWHKEAQRYAAGTQRLKDLIESDALKQRRPDSMLKRLNSLLSSCGQREFHIALVGTIKAGKSSLLNAIIGEELASTSVTPETATLTKFRASKDGTNYLDVSYYTQREWDVLWESVKKSQKENPTHNIFFEEYNKLKADVIKREYLGKKSTRFQCQKISDLKEKLTNLTSSQCPEHYFVKEVEVCLSELSTPPEVVFVDTPGLDDIVQYRSNITRDYIHRANAVLVCVSAEAMDGNALKTITSVFDHCYNNPGKVYILGTKIDVLNKPQRDWTRQQDHWVKIMREGFCFRSEDLARRHTFGISSYILQLIRQYDRGNKDGEEDLMHIARKMKYCDARSTPEETLAQGSVCRKKLLEFANVERLLKLLDKEIIANYKAVMVNDIYANYTLCRNDIESLVKSVREDAVEHIQTCNETIEEMQGKIDRLRTELQKLGEDEKRQQGELQKLEEQFTEAFDEIKRTIRK